MVGVAAGLVPVGIWWVVVVTSGEVGAGVTAGVVGAGVEGPPDGGWTHPAAITPTARQRRMIRQVFIGA
jgi:hypothetical protein